MEQKEFFSNFVENINTTTMGERKDTCILVELYDGRKFIFGSLSAIYDTLTQEEIGIPKEGLWASKLEYDVPFLVGGNTITKMERFTKKQTNPRNDRLVDADLSIRALNAAKLCGARTISELARVSVSELKKIRGVGKSTVQEIIDFVESKGFQMKQ